MSRERRSAGYTVFGSAFDYLLHLRPAEWPIVAVHFLTGTALAVGLRGVLDGGAGRGVLTGMLGFVVGVNGGTLALNSAFDRDEGDIAYLRSPPPPPRGLAGFGAGMMVLGLLLAIHLPGPFLAASAACVGLSILYSVPPIRLKAVAGFDWVINMAGFGFLVPYAGWAVAGSPLTPVGTTILVGFALLFGSLYPLTQLYQLEEDRRRGDRTLAAALGLDGSLILAIGFAVLAFAVLVLAGFRSGWRPDGDRPIRWAALAAGALCWAAVLLPWWHRRRTHSPAEHQRGMHRALAAWAVTDLAVLYAFAR